MSGDSLFESVENVVSPTIEAAEHVGQEIYDAVVGPIEGAAAGSGAGLGAELMPSGDTVGDAAESNWKEEIEVPATAGM